MGSCRRIEDRRLSKGHVTESIEYKIQRGRGQKNEFGDRDAELGKFEHRAWGKVHSA